MESSAARIAAAPITRIAGRWQRHAPAAYPERALDGRRNYGRWGTAAGFQVLYLGRPTESVIVEAYRHLVDPIEDPALLAEIKPRILVTCELELTDVLDLRTAGARLQVGLTMQDVQSPIEDRDAYARCQQVAQIAHQLGRHGIIVPAATEFGETLAVFTDLLPDSERPRRSAPDMFWETLPHDPRTTDRPRGGLRLIRDDRGSDEMPYR